MTEEVQQQKPAKSAAAIKASIEAQLKDAKVSAFKGDLKKMIEEMQSAEKVYLAKKSAVEEFMHDNAELFA